MLAMGNLLYIYIEFKDLEDIIYLNVPVLLFVYKP